MQHSKGLSIGSPFVLLKKKTPVRMSEGGEWGSRLRKGSCDCGQSPCKTFSPCAALSPRIRNSRGPRPNNWLLARTTP